jgi:S-formylglutathione hydrolase FrmB
MAFATIQYFSRSLQLASSFNVVFPDDPAIKPPWAAFYLLHGLSDDHSIWARRSRIEWYVEGLPLVVVMPYGGRGWYTNAVNPPRYKYEDDLVRDVIGLVDRTFPVKAERSGRAIGGLSMGGYGAVKLGLKYPDLFTSVTSHSGALAFPRRPEEAAELSLEFTSIFGDHPEGGPEDPFALAAELSPGRAPALRIDCGDEDFLIEHNREFHRHLDDLGIAHEYEEFSGTHDWNYWDAHVQDAIKFHMANLKFQ